jgi:nucleoside-triphosphatase THEP1
MLTRFTLITGPRDSGKTLRIVQLAEEMRRAGGSVGGVIAEASLRDGAKVAYSLRNLATDERYPYAFAREEGSPGYRFAEEGLAFGRAVIRRAVAEGVDGLFVDEMGPLEMAGNGLWGPVQEACVTFAGLIFLTVRPSLLAECMKRLAIPEDLSIVITLPAATTQD